MVEDHSRLLSLPEGISTIVDIFFLSASDADETDDVVGTRTYCTVTKGNTRVGGCLSGDGDVVFDGEVALQGDDTSYIEHHDAICFADSIA